MRLTNIDRRVALIALSSRLLTCALATLLGWAVVDYDSSAEFALPSKARRPFTWLVWDTVFYDRISVVGYEYEQFQAFLPLLPGLLRLARFLARLLANSDDFQPPASSTDAGLQGTPALVTAVGLLVSNVAFVVSAVLLHRLSVAVLRDQRQARLALLFYSFTPASVFHSALYTESLFGLLTTAGCYCLHCGRRTWLAATCFALSAAIRSNGVVSCGFLLHQAAVSVLATRSWAARCKEALGAVTGSALVALPFAVFQKHGYDVFCSGEAHRGSPRPWCGGRVPYPYGYVQQRYWGVGFLRYWRLQQAPNFLLAAPVLLVALAGVVAYARSDLRRFLTGGLLPSKHRLQADGTVAQRRSAGQTGQARSAAQKRAAPSGKEAGLLRDEAAVYIFHLLFLTLVAATTMHVQVATRFLSSSPALYWSMAHLSTRGHRWLWAYCFLYLALGCLLFVNFYPWT